MNNQSSLTDPVSDIASAPGDLPFPAIEERHARKATQFRHDNTISPTAPLPGQAVTVTASSGASMLLSRAEIWYTTDGSWPDAASNRIPMTIADVDWSPRTRYLYEWQAVIPGQPVGTTVRYKIAGYSAGSADNPAATPTTFAHDGSGFWFYLGEAGITTFAYRVRQEPVTLPDWMADAIIYHIFLDRFHPGTADGTFPPDLDPNERHGGTLQGVIKALPYLSDLGINCLWLSPIGPSSTYHRYDQTDFFGVDSELGTMADLRALIDAAHERGIRIILDYVPSHCSWEMPEFVAARQDQNAPAYDWFVFDEWPDKYRCFLNVIPFLPSFNTESESARRYLIDGALHWLCDIGFDGLRLDHSIGHGKDFWVQFSNEVEKAKPDAALFGEATDTPENLRKLHGRLQGFLDFPLAQTLRLTFGRNYWGIKELAGMLEAYERFMHNGPGRVTFFDNHDMNRFLFEADNDTRRVKLAALCLLTLPYAPVLYYGTEIGLYQAKDKNAAGFGGDSEIRRDMLWDSAEWDNDLLAFFKKIIALRNRYPTLRRGNWQTSIVEVEKQVFGYKMSDDSAEFLVLFNLSDEPEQIVLPDQSAVEPLLTTNGDVTPAPSENGLEITLPTLGGVLLLAE
jgi:glycosidase